MSREKVPTIGHPDDLPQFAHRYWPDLTRWPTVKDVEAFRRATRGNPDARLAVLNGLWSWSEIDLAPVWAWASTFVALAAASLGGVIAVQITWVQVLISLVALVVGSILLTAMISFSSTADLRRRRSHVWLRAFEAGLSGGRFIR